MENHRKRIERALGGLGGVGADSLLVLSCENRFYLSGFTATDTGFDESAGALLITADKLFLLTDSRYELAARQEAPLYDLVLYKGDFTETIASLVAGNGLRRLGVEMGRISHSSFLKLSNSISEKGADVELLDATPVLKTLRCKKEESEIGKIASALALAEDAFEQFLLNDLDYGISERQAAWLIEKRMREMGAESVSFPVIAAFGQNSAVPHAVCGDRTVQPGTPLLFDWGARVGGYCSDTTRSFVLGSCDEDYRRAHAAVYEAQQKAIEEIRPGVSAREIDAIARKHLEDSGFKDRFGHGLGHGVGIAIHEAPSLSPLSDAVLEEGMVVTIEPGIYIPQWGGIRLENMVVVRSDGAQVLNRLECSKPELEK